MLCLPLCLAEELSSESFTFSFGNGELEGIQSKENSLLNVSDRLVFFADYGQSVTVWTLTNCVIMAMAYYYLSIYYTENTMYSQYIFSIYIHSLLLILNSETSNWCWDHFLIKHPL